MRIHAKQLDAEDLNVAGGPNELKPWSLHDISDAGAAICEKPLNFEATELRMGSGVRTIGDEDFHIMPGISSVAPKVRDAIRYIEDWWFDTTRHVRTTGYVHSRRTSQLAAPTGDEYDYLPARAANAREVLDALPIRDSREYTFIDMGSGKGRSLFVAAERPFHKIIGVEYSGELHQQAEANIRTFRRPHSGCANIESVHANAAEYSFPPGKLVIYVFNPFGPEVMSRMLGNLARSLEKEPRHVVLVLLWPELSAMLDATNWLRLHAKTRRYDIYETLQGDLPAM